MDDAFDRYDQRPSKTKKVNSLAYCSQAVLAAAEDMKEAAVGAASGRKRLRRNARRARFEPEIVAFLRRNAEKLETAKLPDGGGFSALSAAEAAATLREIAGGNREQESCRGWKIWSGG